MVKAYPFVRGIASYVFPKKIFKRPGSGGTFSSEYCYSVWLRHLVQLKSAGLIENTREIKKLAEIGPGDSLGIGLASMYSGVENYYAFDVIHHANVLKNNIINNELLNFFKQRREIPHGTHQLRSTNPVLKNWEFPQEMLDYDDNYYDERHRQIENDLNNFDNPESNISYVVPWMGQSQTQVKDLDLIISQAVMEHVYDIDFAYAEMFRWLKTGGIMSHQIDFKTHEMTKEWDGHFYIKSGIWDILAHGRKYPMNRLPLSAHIKALQKIGFTIQNVVPVINYSNFPGKQTRVPGVVFQQDDFITSSALIQAVKK